MEKEKLENAKKFLLQVKNMSMQERRLITHEQLEDTYPYLTEEEKVEFSGLIGYPVFIREAFGEVLQHQIPILQDGSSIVVINDKNQMLLQRRGDNGKWGLPGGCQELGETFEEVAIRELKEETNLDAKIEDLTLISVVSGYGRKRSYPNGDIVFNNTVLYMITKFTGELKWDEESKEMKWFDLDKIPQQEYLHDDDLIYKGREYKLKNSTN